MPNNLIHATSPYLLQHAHNPVDWYEWGPEPLQKAIAEDKPILVSIGYSSCHWCHVMERESFENDTVAAVMNKSFVCIKVDREERPDIDQVYMDAVHILGVQGGWPLNVFLTPEQKPFFGGTYFTPQVWVEVLTNIERAYRANRDQIEETAEELRMHLLASDVARFKQTSADADLIPELNEVYNKLQLKFDRTWGGMDKEPKFIMPSIWLFLLRLSNATKNSEALNHVVFTLKKISMGGIYDQVGGGFCRYSVDRYWFAPHFEKMLYDNAQLLSLYSEAYSLTKDASFKKVIYETFDWLSTEMTNQDGGFYSALDADSEGSEGKFYTWTSDEIVDILGPDSTIVSNYYGVKEEGNWEHGNNILMRTKDDTQFLRENSLTASEWKTILQQAKEKLLAARSQRVRPGLDDKIITAWNAMTICGLTDAYKALGDRIFLDAAMKNIEFIEQKLSNGTMLFRSFRNERSTVEGFLDDYAFAIRAYISLYQATFNERNIYKAAQLTEYVIDHFFDPSDGFFFYTSNDAEALITRKKEIFDNVISSSNAVMAQNLNHLGSFFDRQQWKTMAEAMVGSLSHLVKSEPGFMSHWAILYTEIRKGIADIVLVGNGVDHLRSELHQHFLPFALVQGGNANGKLPLQQGKTMIDGNSTIYVCYNKTCRLPVHTVADALQQLDV